MPYADPPLRRTRVSAWRTLGQVGRIDWSQVAVGRGLRAALCVVAPLVVGWLVGHLEQGAWMALGALTAGYASFQGETRRRVAVVVLASGGMAASTFVGAIASAPLPWLLVPIVAVWGYACGLSVCLGPASSVAVLQWAVALLIAVGLPMPLPEAALRAGFVLAGGLLQAVLVAASWTVGAGRRERAALAASYRALAAYAGDLACGRSTPPSPAALPAAGVLADPNPLLPRSLHSTLLDLLEEAERMRATLATLAAYVADHLPAEGNAMRALVAQVAAALDLGASMLAATGAEHQSGMRDLEARVAALAVDESAPWRWSGEALLGQLRAALRTMVRLEDSSRRVGGTNDGRMSARDGDCDGLASRLALLHANMTASTEAGRHALRLAAIAAIAEAVVQATGLYEGRWVTLTIFIVLKPDYRSTMSRGIDRAIGTAAGAVAAAVLAPLAQSDGGAVAVAAIAVAAAYVLYDASYLFFSLTLTVFVLILFALLGAPVPQTAEARVLDTCIGSALALVAYALWPTWQGTTAQEKFARLVEVHRDYASALLQALANSAPVDAARLRASQAAAGRARSDAEAATARLSDEPVRTPATPAFAQLVMATMARLAHAELALHAFVLSPHWTALRPLARAQFGARLDDLRQALGAAMDRIAGSLRGSARGGPAHSLRPLYAALSRAPDSDATLVVLADRLVEATDTLDAIVHGQPGAGP